jgi:DNA-binding MarR family transcriptional regulator/GNAT superfamily N-acetyltransferase
MDFIEKAGKKAIGSRLRRLSERLTADAAQLYQLYGVELQPKWFPVFFVLSEGQEKPVTAIAEEIGHSHPSVIKIIAEMARKGLVTERKGKKDARVNVVSLSKKGMEIKEKISSQYTDVGQAIDEIFLQTRHDLWKALEEWEYQLGQKSLLKRVQEQRKQRESLQVRITDYHPKYKKAFYDLNEEWISKYFTMEKEDLKALENPKGYILDKGGFIFVALYNDEPLGVCAMIKKEESGGHYYEMAKMAVSPKAQGKNIGFLLGQAVIQKAKQMSATKVYLESNTILQPAIHLYQKLGFQRVVAHASPYARSNIQMELALR